MMLNESEDTTDELRNVDNTNPFTNTESCYVAIELPRKQSLVERLRIKMYSHSRETICLFIAILFSLTFAGLHSKPPRVSRPPVASPFFNQNSLVVDFYRGQMSAMIERASTTDISFVMFYAPWDAESQIVRHEFEIVAKHYHSQIFFAAINCWHPGSECRAQYSKIQSYPVLILYPVRGSGVQYRGINTAPYIMRFLDDFLKPIRKISNGFDLSELFLESESVVVGFIDFQGLPVSPGYTEFYKSSVKILEKDPNRDTIFAIVTNKEIAIKEFNIQQFPSASLYMWNESLIYPHDKLWTTSNIVHWIDTSIHKVSTWLQPPGIKSLTLAPYLHNGPVLFLFTPRNPYHKMNYNYNLLREVALEYYNCDKDIWPSGLVELLENQRSQAQIKHHQKIKKCKNILTQFKQSQEKIVPISISIQRWINDSCCAKVFMNKCLSCESSEDICTTRPKYFHEICSKKDVFKANNEIERHYCCDDDPGGNFKNQDDKMEDKKIKTSMLPRENDTRSAGEIKKFRVKEECERFLIGNKYHEDKFPEESVDLSSIELTASACSANRSLAFIAIDSFHYYHFSEGLGIDILKIKDKTSVVILDSLQESQYVMSSNLSRNSLVEFLNKYSNGSLQRTLRSDSSRRFARDFQSSPECNDNKMEICIPELTTETFLPTILDKNKNVIVFYHSPYCAFCSAISYVYLTVANYLSKMNNLLFVRIDGDNNDLPWEYSMNRYPSILYFPAKKKDDSTVYPFSLPITIPNLLNFILINLDSDSRIEALVNVCHIGAGESPPDCVSRIRRLCLDTIQNLLQKHRKLLRQRIINIEKINNTKNNKRNIYLKLDLIRDIHLILSSVEDLSIDEEKYNLISQKFSTYYDNLKIDKNNYDKISNIKDEL